MKYFILVFVLIFSSAILAKEKIRIFRKVTVSSAGKTRYQLGFRTKEAKHITISKDNVIMYRSANSENKVSSTKNGKIFWARSLGPLKSGKYKVTVDGSEETMEFDMPEFNLSYLPKINKEKLAKGKFVWQNSSQLKKITADGGKLVVHAWVGDYNSSEEYWYDYSYSSDFQELKEKKKTTEDTFFHAIPSGREKYLGVMIDTSLWSGSVQITNEYYAFEAFE